MGMGRMGGEQIAFNKMVGYLCIAFDFLFSFFCQIKHLFDVSCKRCSMGMRGGERG